MCFFLTSSFIELIRSRCEELEASVVFSPSMSNLGAFGLLILGLLVSGLFVCLGAIPVLLVRNLIAKQPAWTGVRTWLLYPLLAILVSACGVGAFLYAANKGIDDYTTVRWMNIAITTALVFGYAVKKFWLFRKKWGFWAELTILAVAHCVLLSRLHWQQPGYSWLPVVVGIPELSLVLIVLGLTFPRHENLIEQDLR